MKPLFSFVFRLLTALLLAALLLVGQSARPAYAAGYVINHLGDSIANDGVCTLREAIQEANNGADTDCPGLPNAGDDTITFSVSGTVVLSTMLPNIESMTTGALTIDGGGNIVISGSNIVRVISVNPAANLTLQNLTIADGFSNGSGGGIYNSGTLNVTNSTFFGNNASAGTRGGGIYNNGTLTVTNSTFSNNSATDNGGGIYNAGNNALTVTTCTFSRNSATDGGAIYNLYGTLSVTNSTFSQNSASGKGGGIFNYGGLTVADSAFSANSASLGGGIYNYFGELPVTNSTFSSNSATNYGGGIYNFTNGMLTVANSNFSTNSATNGGGGIGNSGTLTVAGSTFRYNSTVFGSGGGIYNADTLNVTNSTFSNNSADIAGGGIDNETGSTLNVTNSTFSANSASGGGGVWNAGTATLKNTIVANSTSGGDCVGTLSGTNNNNLIESTGTNACSLTNGSNGNIIGVDPNLGALTGSPAYFPLNHGSQAIDKGNNTTCAAAPVNNQSQNGMKRPQDGNGNGLAVCDIGSYEATSIAVFRSIGSQDGWVLESGETSNQGGTFNSTATTFRLGDDASDRQYRTILSFNTGSLPDTAIITRVTLKIRKQGLVGTNPFTILGGLRVDIRKPYFGSGAALAAGDFQAAASQNNIGSIPNTPVSGWYSKTWTSGAFFSSINRTGLTQFRLRFATDDNNDNGADYLAFYSGNATASARPILIIQYYVP